MFIHIADQELFKPRIFASKEKNSMMIKKLHYLIALLLITFVGMESVAQTTIYTQDFEISMSGYSNSPDQLPSVDPGDQYFSIAEPSDNTIYESNGQLYTNVTNSFLFVGSNPNSINSGNPGIINLSPITITGFSNIVLNADFGAVPNDWDAADEILVQYNIDGDGTNWQTAVAFRSNATNSPLVVVSNATGGANTPNGTILNFDLQTITSDNFVGVGNVLNVRILVDSGANYEAFGMDNIVITGLMAGGNAAPSITNISNTPTNPESTDAVTITADVTDSDGVASVELQYGFTTGVYDQTPIAMNNSSGDTYTAAIAAQADGTTVFYQIVATDSNASPATATSAEQSYTVMDPVPAPSLIITEVADPGDEFTGRFVEIYNNGASIIDFNTTEIHFARQSNGGNISSIRLTGTLNSGEFYVIGNSSNIMTQYGIPADLDFGSVTGNGDDGYFLYAGGDENNGTLFDSYGVLGEDGSGQPWEYEDSRAVRNSLSDMPSATWQSASWTITPADVADMTPGEGENTTYTYDAGVWTPNAPSDVAGKSTSNDNIIVISGSIALIGDIDIRNITVMDGATLDLGSNTVNITRDLNATSTATLTGGDAVVNFAGITEQEINVTSVNFKDLFVNTSNGLTLNGQVDIEGSLQLTNGLLSTNDNLTFKSVAGKSAILMEVVSGSITGNVTVEQFYPAQRAFRFVSSPVTMDGTIFTNWQQNGLNPGDSGYEAGNGAQITGGTLANGFDQNTSNNPSAFIYNNTTGNWGPISSTNDPVANSLEAGDAVRIFVRGDRGIDLTTNDAPSDTKLITTGTLEIGDVTVTDINAVDGGFSLIGNPYQAQVNLETLFADATATNDLNTSRYYAWDPTINPNGGYVLYDFSTGSTVVGSEVNQFLQPNQSFFLTTNDDMVGTVDPTLTFKESFKSASSITTAVYSDYSIQGLLRVNLMASSEVATGRARDGVVLKFNDLGNNGVDHNDAYKIFNPNENLSIFQDSSHLTISELQNPIDGQEIQLSLSGLLENSYTLRIDNTYTDGQYVYLNDAFSGTNTLLNSGVNMISKDFDPANAASVDPLRFKLVFSTQTLGLDNLNVYLPSVYPNPLGNEDLIIGNLNAQESLSVEVYNSTGQLLNSYEKQPSYGTQSLKGFSVLKKGLYFVTLKQGNSITTVKLLKK